MHFYKFICIQQNYIFFTPCCRLVGGLFYRWTGLKKLKFNSSLALQKTKKAGLNGQMGNPDLALKLLTTYGVSIKYCILLYNSIQNIFIAPNQKEEKNFTRKLNSRI